MAQLSWFLAHFILFRPMFEPDITDEWVMVWRSWPDPANLQGQFGSANVRILRSLLTTARWHARGSRPNLAVQTARVGMRLFKTSEPARFRSGHTRPLRTEEAEAGLTRSPLQTDSLTMNLTSPPTNYETENHQWEY